jgi:16S rRNA G1207 methylase RsmC
VYVTQGDVDYGSEALLARLASKQSGFLDAGANIGYYSA